MPDLDVSAPIRAALLAEVTITSLLPVFEGSKAIFTRRPVPDEAPLPLLIVSPDISISDADGINDFRPIVRRDVSVYGRNDTSAHYRTVELLAYAIRDLFHANREAIDLNDYGVMDIRATGPRPAPVDDEQMVGRVVSLTIRLARK